MPDWSSATARRASSARGSRAATRTGICPRSTISPTTSARPSSRRRSRARSSTSTAILTALSLYPGQATTELCPTTTFDGEPLYRDGEAPGAEEIAERRARYYAPYHEALRIEIARLRAKHARVALYDAHSIRSIIPRLFEGELPIFNLGTNSGRSCSASLRDRLTETLAASGRSFMVDGRFKGGWITRSFGAPDTGVEAVQLELACRAYMIDPSQPWPDTWPGPIDALAAEPTRATLRALLENLLDWVQRAALTSEKPQ